MQVKAFLLTLGIGMAEGGAVAMMLPQQSSIRKTAKKAVDSVEQGIANVMQ